MVLGGVDDLLVVHGHKKIGNYWSTCLFKSTLKHKYNKTDRSNYRNPLIPTKTEEKYLQ